MLRRFGIKPARGRITNAPLRAEGWGGCSTSGPIARTVRDAAWMLDLMAGPVVGDAYWAPPPAKPFIEAINRGRRNLRLATLCETPSPMSTRKLSRHSNQPARRCVRWVIASNRSSWILSVLMIPASMVAVAGIGSIEVADPGAAIDPVITRNVESRPRNHRRAVHQRNAPMMHNLSRDIVQRLAPFDALHHADLDPPGGQARHPARPRSVEDRQEREASA